MWGTIGVVVSQKGANSFLTHLDYNFLKFLKLLLPSQLYENSRFGSKAYIYARIFAQFSLRIQKFFYRPFAKGSNALDCGPDDNIASWLTDRLLTVIGSWVYTIHEMAIAT